MGLVLYGFFLVLFCFVLFCVVFNSTQRAFCDLKLPLGETQKKMIAQAVGSKDATVLATTLKD